MMTSTASTALCTARTGPPRRVWRRGSRRSHPRAKTYGRRWFGTFPSMSPLKAPTPMAGHRSCLVCMDQTCLGTTWFEAMGQCMCPSHPAGTKGPSPCLSQNPHLNYRSLQASGGSGLPWLVASSLQPLPPWSHGLLLCVSNLPLFPFLMWICVMASWTHLDSCLISRSLT
ncbi:B9 domain-containing protein 1 isoform X4 [Carlito syrichta]|uniref:B9 domain-containing protein 1 isoform X4 n=1 Tax=Carlito syrichta TaxID=1868482 RepID=A0A3Q0EK36_CARSF|nr:B9 domain-containing protein 1 isoform X4 [Carlito syrichta]